MIFIAGDDVPPLTALLDSLRIMTSDNIRLLIVEDRVILLLIYLMIFVYKHVALFAYNVLFLLSAR